MSKIIDDLMYSKEHEWIKAVGDIITIGITDFAQSELGDIIFVEMPESGTEIKKDEPFGTIEAVKTVTDLVSPVNGKLMEINPELEDNPELVNQDCYNKGWFAKIKLEDLSELDDLLNPEEYKAIID